MQNHVYFLHPCLPLEGSDVRKNFSKGCFHLCTIACGEGHQRKEMLLLSQDFSAWWLQRARFISAMV